MDPEEDFSFTLFSYPERDDNYHTEINDEEDFLEDFFNSRNECNTEASVCEKENSHDNATKDDCKSGSDYSSAPLSPEVQSEKIPENAIEVQVLIEKLKQDAINWRNEALELKTENIDWRTRALEAEKRNLDLANDCIKYKEKFAKGQEELSRCEIRLSEYMNDSLNKDRQLQLYEISDKDLRSRLADLTEKLELKQAESNQFRNYAGVVASTSEELNTVRQQLFDSQKKERRYKRNYRNSLDSANRKNRELLKIRKDNERLAAQLIEAYEVLFSNNLLISKQFKEFESFMEHYEIPENLLISKQFKEFESFMEHYEIPENINENSYLSQEEENATGNKNLNYSVENKSLPNESIKKEITSGEELTLTSLSSIPLINDSSLSPGTNNIQSDVSNNVSFDNTKIPGESFVLKTMKPVLENTDIIQPIPKSVLGETSLHSDKIENKEKFPSDCKKNKLYHQASGGFEPHIEEKSESTSSLTNRIVFTSKNPSPSQTSLISKKLDYISSAFINNSYQIVHDGYSAFDSVSDADEKLSVVVLTLPYKSYRNHDCILDEKAFPSMEERRRKVELLYNEALKERMSVVEKNFNLEDKTEKSENDSLPYVFIKMNYENGQVIIVENPENNSESDNYSNPSLAIKEQSPEVIHEENCASEYIKTEITDNQPFTLYDQDVSKNKLDIKENKNHFPSIVKTVDDYTEAIEKNKFNENTESRSNEQENHVHEYAKKEVIDNQLFTSSLCDISSQKKKLDETIYNQNVNQNNINIKVKENNLSFTDKSINKYAKTIERNQSDKNEENISFERNNSYLATKEISTEIHKEDYVPEYVKREINDNQPFTLNSSAISSLKRKIDETVCDQNVEKNKLVIKENENQLPIIAETKYDCAKTIERNNFNENKESNNSEISNPCLAIKKQSPEITLSENHAPKYFKREIINNQQFTLSSCSVSSHKRKVDEIMYDQSDFENKLGIKENGSNEINNSKYSLSEKSSDTKFKRQFHVINDDLNTFKNSFAVAENNIPESLKSEENSHKKIISTPDHINSMEENNPNVDMHSPIAYDNNLQNSLSCMKQTLFQESDIAKQAVKNKSYISDNSNEFEKEKIIEYPILKCETAINANPHKKMKKYPVKLKDEINNYSNLSIKNTYTDIELPASKKSKLSVNDASERINDSVSNSIDTSKSSIEMLNLQSSVLLNDNSSIKRPYGIFKNDDCSSNRKSNVLNRFDILDSSKNVENETRSIDSKSVNANDLSYTMHDNLDNHLKKKKKNRKKKKSSRVKNHSSPYSSGVCCKKCKKFGDCQCSQNIFEERDKLISINADQKHLTDKNNLLIEKVSDNELKFSNKEQNGLLNFSNVTIPENIQIGKDSLKNDNIKINLHSQELSVSSQDISVKTASTEKCNKQTLSDAFEKSCFSPVKINDAFENQISYSDHLLSETYRVYNQNNISEDENLVISDVEHSNQIFENESDIEKDKNEFTIVMPTNITEENENKTTVIKIPGISDQKKMRSRRDSCQSNISGDGSLVIADDGDCNEIFENELNIKREKDEVATTVPIISPEKSKEMDSTVTIKRSAKTKQKKRKSSKAHSKNKHKNSLTSCDEDSISVSCTIAEALNDIRNMKMQEMLTNHSKYKLLQHKFINAIINPANAPNTASALQQIFTFLSSSNLNPLLSFVVNQNIAVFYPPAENCIVEALIKTEKKKKIHLERLISSAISTLYCLILEKKQISKAGLGALCRVFTQLCKLTDNKLKPIRLSCDLLQEQHPLAPVLIAFIIGTWVELFDPKEDRGVFRILLLSAISVGLEKKPQTVTSQDWNACKMVFSVNTLVSLPENVQDVDLLISIMTKYFVKKQPVEMAEWRKDVLLIFAATNGWDWAEKKLVHVVAGKLNHYAKVEDNEEAFSFFVDLYADLGKVAPQDNVCIIDTLKTLYLEDKGFDYVKKHAAISMLNILLFLNKQIPQEIHGYINKNYNIPNQTKTMLYLKRRCIRETDELTEDDIFIT